MADLSAVVNQLKINNEEERARDSSLNRNIAQSRLETSDGLQKLSESIIKNTATMLKDVTVPIVKEKMEEDKKKADAELKKTDSSEKGRVLLFSNLAKQNQGIVKTFKGIKGLFSKNKGKEKADANRQFRFTNIITNSILGLNKKFNGFVSSIANSAKEKGKNVLDILKKFAMVGALGALVAFLNSKMFQDMKDTVIPALKTGLTAMYNAFVNLKDGFFDIVGGFTNEQGEFDFIAGIKNAIDTIGEKFGGLELGLLGLLLFLKPVRFFGKVAFMAGKGLFSVSLGLIKGAFGLLSGNFTSMGSALETTNTEMKDKVKKEKGKGGKLGKGKFGLLSRFGRLFGKIGLVGGLIAGATSLMDVDLKNSKVFSKVGDAFKGMFSVVGDFTKSLLGIKKAATADLKKTVADADPNAKKKADADANAKKKAPKRPEEIRREKQLKAQNDVELKKKQADNLAKARAAKKKAQMDLFKNADAESVKNFKATQKAAQKAAEKTAKQAGKEVSEKLSKEAAALVAKSATKSAIKKVPVVGIIAGLVFGFQRALEGEFVKAGAEVVSGVAGTFAGPGTAAAIAIDAGMLADDLGVLKKKGKPTASGDAVTPTQTANNGGGIDPIAQRTGGPPVVINNVDNSKVSTDNSQATNTVTHIDDRGLHPSMLLVQ